MVIDYNQNKITGNFVRVDQESLYYCTYQRIQDEIEIGEYVGEIQFYDDDSTLPKQNMYANFVPSSDDIFMWNDPNDPGDPYYNFDSILVEIEGTFHVCRPFNLE